MIIVKRFGVLMLLMAALFVSATGFQSVQAQTAEGVVTPEHIERIRGNCASAQNRLSQLHANDALLRVNRGQAYESISAKLMATMNGRIALNRLDGGELVDIAARYEEELVLFRSAYQQYEQRMSELLRIDCTKQPVTFYDMVAEVRDLRAVVHSHVVNLHQAIFDYQAAFDRFSTAFDASIRNEGIES